MRKGTCEVHRHLQSQPHRRRRVQVKVLVSGSRGFGSRVVGGPHHWPLTEPVWLQERAAGDGARAPPLRVKDFEDDFGAGAEPPRGFNRIQS